MSGKNLELAHEFSTLVGASDLLAYLGMDHTASVDELRAKLKEKRKYMQGMQSNPKYKKQALFMIKHFSALDAVLQTPLEYIDDVRRRQESEHLPVLEMTIKGVLKGGRLTGEQAEFLRHQAGELGISEQTFQETLDRLCTEMGVAAPLPELSESEKASDHYAVLGVNNAASRDSIYDAYRTAYREAKGTPEPAAARSRMEAADQAWRVLGDPRTREAYDLARQSTAPPATQRESTPTPSGAKAPTAPPVRQRTAMPDTVPGAPRLEIFGEPVRRFGVANSPVHDEIRLRTAMPMNGFVTSTAPEWLRVEPAHLSPTTNEQTLRVTILPEFEEAEATGAIHIVTERGDRAQIVFEAKRRKIRPVTAFLAVAAILAIGLAVLLGSMNTIQGGGQPGLTIQIDPSADDVLLNSQSVGSGSVVYVANPPTGGVKLRVSQRNFRTYEQQITVPADQALEVPVMLELTEAMDFKPTAQMIQGTLDQEVVQKVMKPRSKAMDACIAIAAEPGKTMSGTVRIHIRQSGRAQGVEMEGDGINDPRVRTCLTRQAAAVYVHPLEEGDYATVRYDYQVTP